MKATSSTLRTGMRNPPGIKAGVRLYSAALRMGVHTSQDWESVNLGNIHDLGFFCRPSEAGEAQP